MTDEQFTALQTQLNTWQVADHNAMLAMAGWFACVCALLVWLIGCIVVMLVKGR